MNMSSSEPQAHEDPKSCPAGQCATPVCDVEKRGASESSDEPKTKQSAFKNLGILDKLLAVWIFLAMAIGIILGNFVPSTGPTLERGKFVGVSVPIGEYS